ncbi:uncharacterized protein LOC119080230 isoform X2 [Bradysia coprophila]|uniref:uncharacterized protein LOC119080230 isoform X2 n=1 Tax=Bradysia coprophila TaxID=38358 RepID=UPI00187DAC10|nr:uncharacterized protein LOC119080230 isoform X2 [Bradysia coprophila]
MKILTLYSTSVNTTYKNSICSCAALFVFLSTVFIVVAPIYLIIHISNDLWYQPKIFYEQPSVSFQYKYILMGEHGPSSVDNSDYTGAVDGSSSLAVISSYGHFNEITETWQKRSTVKFWKEDFDHNNIADRLHLQFTYAALPEPLTYLNIFLELDAHIKNHHCKLHKFSIRPHNIRRKIEIGTKGLILLSVLHAKR